MNKYASKVVKQAQAWLGYNEADGSHKKIIDVYNSHKPLARGYAVKYTDEWCATYVSAVAVQLGYIDIMPTECGCEEMIKLYQKLGAWDENDARVPNPGEIIFYDWQDNGVGDNTGYANHVGIVEKVANGVITVIEGNYKNAVTRREIAVNAKYIRGYGVPKYDKEVVVKKSITEVAKDVINGKYGVGNARKAKLAAEGHDYNAVQKEVNRLLDNKTAEVKVDSARSYKASKAGTYKVRSLTGLKLRAGAGTSKAILETMKNGSKVTCYGYYTGSWLYVISESGKTGFCHAAYLKKV